MYGGARAIHIELKGNWALTIKARHGVENADDKFTSSLELLESCAQAHTHAQIHPAENEITHDDTLYGSYTSVATLFTYTANV